MRPILHFTPPQGWMNDPNGLIQRDGVHHLFYQANPYAARMNRIHWGHATSPDLLNWTVHPIALVPDEAYDTNGCWSGVTVDVDGRLVLLYSGNDGGPTQTACLAWADDALERFTKDAANPVIVAPAGVTEFRDHSVSRRADGTWRQVIGGGSGEVGQAFAFTSTDFRTWTAAGTVADSTTVALPGPIWECPDLVAFGDEALLMVSVLDKPDGHTSMWAVGVDDGSTFTADATGIMDVGDRFYAPQSYWTADGRRIMFAWLRTQLDPGASADWTGTMSLPREISIRAGRFWTAPARELRAARGAAVAAPVAQGSTTTDLDLTGHVAAEIEVPAPVAATVTAIRLTGDDGATFAVDPGALTADGGPLTVFVDAGVIEAFGGGRAGAWSHLALGRVRTVVLEHAPAAAAAEVTVWPLTP